MLSLLTPLSERQETEETERRFDRVQELVDQTCQNNGLKASEWFLFGCVAVVEPK